VVPARQHEQVEQLLCAALAPALESLDAWARRWSDALRETGSG
jgi:hypothetical protein